MNTEDRVDIIVLGATGFTGKYVAKKLALLNKESEYLNLKWGISGRSKQKLQNLLDVLLELDVDTSTIPVIECDIEIEESVINVCRKTKVLMNSTGPSTILSDPVVKACITTGTHYVDISAELHHMVNLYRKYHKEAEASNVLIIPACGFASIPALTGLIQLERHLQGTLHSVEGYVEIDVPKRTYIPGPNNCLVHYGTWECFVFELQNFRKYRELKKQTFPEPVSVPGEMKKSFFHRRNGRYWVPYLGPDHDIVEMTQEYLREKRGKMPYHFKIYTTLPLFIHFIFIVPAFYLAYLLSYFTWFCYLMKKFPRIFSFGYISHKGPTEKMMNDTKYSFYLNGKGWCHGTDLNLPPNKTITLKVSGCDPGYKCTATAFVFSAITILKEGNKMPTGGVLTTGAAFCDTQIVDKLNKNGICFEIVEKESQVVEKDLKELIVKRN